jgi:Acetyltransferase (GNAT) domain
MPLPPIATDRLSLRPFTQDDVDVLHAVWTDPDVRRYLWDDIVIPRERAVDVVRSHLESVAASGIGYWVVHTAEDKPVIGRERKKFACTKIRSPDNSLTALCLASLSQQSFQRFRERYPFSKSSG